MSPRIAILTLMTAFALGSASADDADPAPWRAAGLDDREAAAHLLDRFTYGPRPGEVEAVLEIGLRTWFERQLAADQPDRRLETKLDRLDTLRMPAEQIADTFPNPGQVLRQAQREGASVMAPEAGESSMERPADRQRGELGRYFREQGYRSQRELLGQQMTWKLLGATFSENQLREVLADFWSNHLYVSLADNQTRAWLLSYERDAIRPHLFATYREMLGASARHPAMLIYLDNAQSVAAEGARTTMEHRLSALRSDSRRGRRGGGRSGFGARPMGRSSRRGADSPQRPQGLNENYARELLELHTLGVDGGYSQEDVVEVARAMTGWALVPGGPQRATVEERLSRVRRNGAALGFVIDGSFVFRADAHDAGEKVVLGHRLPAGRGIEDGEEVLDLLARHPSTARHLATKIATRFVSDDPPQSLVERIASTYSKTDGDLEACIRTLFESPEFWSPEARGAKVKTPFELVVSALRAVDAEIVDPRGSLEWVAQMGQPLYAYQAPTGYPDRADTWVNTGALLHRMNFGLQLAAGRVEGVLLDLPALDGGKEPESRRAALTTWIEKLMPGRDHSAAVERLIPVASSPDLAERLAEATPEEEKASLYGGIGEAAQGMADGMDPFSPRQRGRRAQRPTWTINTAPPTALEQVVGVILGSPEFQRR